MVLARRDPPLRRRSVLVRYPGDPLYQERFLLGAIGEGRQYVASPDFDIFPMTLSCPPLERVRMLNQHRDLPAGARQADVYMFGEDTDDGMPDAVTLRDMLDQVEDLIACEREMLGLDGPERPRGDYVWVLAEPVERHCSERL
jgi:hypothetical protein